MKQTVVDRISKRPRRLLHARYLAIVYESFRTYLVVEISYVLRRCDPSRNRKFNHAVLEAIEGQECAGMECPVDNVVLEFAEEKWDEETWKMWIESRSKFTIW